MFNIRYLGFEALAPGGRRLQYAITSREFPTRQASVSIPADAFSGPKRVTFQEGATIGYEKLRQELDAGAALDPLSFELSPDDIERFRPRRRAATKRA
jgi:hypothetical protein